MNAACNVSEGETSNLKRYEQTLTGRLLTKSYAISDPPFLIYRIRTLKIRLTLKMLIRKKIKARRAPSCLDFGPLYIDSPSPLMKHKANGFLNDHATCHLHSSLFDDVSL